MQYELPKFKSATASRKFAPLTRQLKSPAAAPLHPILQLQRAIGNHATGRLIAEGFFRREGNQSHSQYEHQDPFARRYRQPEDEKRVNWGDYVKMTPPKDPFVIMSVVPYGVCPFPPNAVLEKMPTHHTQEENAPLFQNEHADKVVVQPWWLGQRQKAWDAYRNAAMQVQAMQEAVAPDINLFFHAEKNSELRALGFITDGYKGNLVDLASRQEVPNMGGPKLGSLFRGEDSLSTTKADEKAIATSAAAMRSGRGTAETGFLETNKADTDLKATLYQMKAASQTIIEKSGLLNSAQAAIDEATAENEAEEAKDEIEQLKKGAEFAKSAIEFAVAAPAKLAKLAEEGIDKLEAVGTVASLLLDIFPSAEMKAATAKLAAAQKNMKTAKARQLQNNLESAKAGLLSALNALEAQKDAVQSAMTARRQAYNLAGKSAGDVAGGRRESQQKIAGIIAAIPIVENVLAALRNISEKAAHARPPYSEEAGLGYGIALYNQSWEAMALPDAIGVLEGANVWFGLLRGDWDHRLQSLMAVKQRIAGTRPGD